MKKRIIIFCLALISLPNSAKAQENEIELLYFNHGDSISFRWGTANGELFSIGARKGYVMQRRIKGQQEWSAISGVMRPASDERFALLESSQPDAVVVRELIYHNSRNQGKKDNKQLEDSPKSGEDAFEDNFLFGMTMYVCDISLEIAKAAALYYMDKPADKTAVYEYRVLFGDQQNAGKVREVTVDMLQKSVLPAPDVLKQTLNRQPSSLRGL